MTGCYYDFTPCALNEAVVWNSYSIIALMAVTTGIILYLVLERMRR